jgi:hypothetical protein
MAIGKASSVTGWDPGIIPSTSTCALLTQNRQSDGSPCSVVSGEDGHLRPAPNGFEPDLRLANLDVGWWTCPS